jgi:hypothetical protein
LRGRPLWHIGMETTVPYPPVSGFCTWDVARNVVYGDANLGDYFGLQKMSFCMARR